MSSIHPVIEKLRQVQSSEKKWLTLFSLSLFTAIVVGSCILVCLADYFVRSDIQVLRIGLTVILSAVVLTAAFRFLVPLMNYRRDLIDIARAIETQNPGLQKRLSLAADFLTDSSQNGSSQLRSQLIEQAQLALSDVSLAQQVRTSIPLRAAFLAVVISTIAIVFFVAQPRETWFACQRVFTPWQSESWPAINHLYFENAPSRLAVGDNFECLVADQNGRLPESVILEIDDGTAKLRREMIRLDERARFNVSAVSRPFRIRASGGDHQTAWHSVDVVSPPTVQELNIDVFPPDYSGLVQSKVGPFEKVWGGSQIRINGRTDLPISRAELVIDNQLPGESESQTSYRRAAVVKNKNAFVFPDSATWLLESPRQFSIKLTGADGLAGGIHRSFRIPVRKDESPVVELSWTDRRRVYGPQDQIKLVLNAADDMQLAAVTLEILHDDEVVFAEKIPFTPLAPLGANSNEQSSISKTVTFNLNKLKSSILEGSYQARALAKDSQGKSSTSKPVEFEIGSPSALAKQDIDSRDEILELLKKALEYQNSAENLSSLVLQEKPLDKYLFGTRLERIAEHQNEIERVLLEPNGVIQKCSTFLTATRPSRSGIVIDEVERIQQEVLQIKTSARIASDESSEAHSLHANHAIAINCLTKAHRLQQQIQSVLVRLVGEIDSQSRIQSALVEIQGILREQSAIQGSCLQLQSSFDADSKSAKIDADRLFNDQKGISSQINELSWSLLNDSKRLNSADIGQLSRRLKVIEIDSRSAATHIAANRFGLGYQSILLVRSKLQELLDQAREGRLEFSPQSREKYRSALKQLGSLTKESNDLSKQIEGWNKLSAGAREQTLRDIEKFREQLNEFLLNHRDLLSEKTQVALAKSQELLEEIPEDLQANDVDSANEKFKTVGGDLQKARDEMESRSSELEKQLRQEKVEDLQRIFANWLETERKIKLTLSSLKPDDKNSVGELAILQQPLTLQMAQTRDNHADFFALRSKLVELENDSKKLEVALREQNREAALLLVDQLITHLDEMLENASQEPDSSANAESNRSDSNSPTQSPADPVLISEFEIQLLRSIQEDILKETQRIQKLREEGGSAQQRAAIKDATLQLADRQSNLIETLKKYLDPATPSKKPDNIPDIPDIPDIPMIDELPEIDCVGIDELLQTDDKQQESESNPDNSNAGPQEKENRIEAVNPFTGQSTRDGEDIGQESDRIRNQLESIQQKMKSVQKLFVDQKISSENQELQNQIIRELKSFKTDQEKKSGKNSTQKEQEQAGKKGEQAATSSDTSQNPDLKNGAMEQKNAGIQKRIDEIWGHLPDRLKKNELNIQSSQFLPKYRELIKAYFKRLANDPEIR